MPRMHVAPYIGKDTGSENADADLADRAAADALRKLVLVLLPVLLLVLAVPLLMFPLVEEPPIHGGTLCRVIR